MLRNYFLYVTPIHIMEVLAAIASLYYLRKVSYLKSTKYLVFFLWITVLNEAICSYAPIAYFSDYKYFSFVKGTPFDDNYWIFNIYTVISFVFYLYYFRFFIQQKSWRKIIKYLAGFFVIGSILSMIFGGVYFEGYNKFTSIAGTLILLVTIVVFYFEILRSDVLLNLKQFLPMYISAGILIYYLCITPIEIFSEYFTSENPFYSQLRIKINLFANIFLYSLFILGFLICSREEKSY